MNEVAVEAAPYTVISTSRRFLKNWGYLFTSSVFCQVLGMISLIRVARVLAPAGYGYFNIVQTSAGISMVIAGLGMRNVIIRDCARNPENTRTLYAASLFARFLLSTVVGIGIVIYALLSPHVLSISLSGFAIMLLLGQIIWDTAESISFGLERMEISSRTNVVGSAIWVLWVWCVPVSALTVGAICFSFALLQISKAALLSWQVNRVLPPAYPMQRASLKNSILSLIIASLPFYWMMLLETAYSGLPVLLLAQRSNAEQVGLFTVGFRLLSPVRLLFLTSTSVLYPYLAKAKIENSAEYLRVIEMALKVALVIGSASAFLVFLLRVEVVSLLFGEKYGGSADAMAFQCVFLALLAIQYIIGTSFLASDRQHLWAVLTTIYTIFTLPIIWIGADHGATELAVAMSVGVALSLIFIWPFFKKSLPSRFQSNSITRFSIVLVIAIICGWLVPSNILLGTKILVACIIFSILAIFLVREWKKRLSST